MVTAVTGMSQKADPVVCGSSVTGYRAEPTALAPPACVEDHAERVWNRRSNRNTGTPATRIRRAVAAARVES